MTVDLLIRLGINCRILAEDLKFRTPLMHFGTKGFRSLVEMLFPD